MNNGKEKERRESSTFQKSAVAPRAECEGEDKKKKKREGESERGQRMTEEGGLRGLSC